MINVYFCLLTRINSSITVSVIYYRCEIILKENQLADLLALEKFWEPTFQRNIFYGNYCYKARELVMYSRE